MSRKSGGRKVRERVTPSDDQEWFIRENAVAIVRARDAQIDRLRIEIAKKAATIRSLRVLVQSLGQQVKHR